MSDTWQPIATAPPFRTVQVWIPADGVHFGHSPAMAIRAALVEGVWWEHGRRHSRTLDREEDQPTHWKPLPAPPPRQAQDAATSTGGTAEQTKKWVTI